MTSQVVWKQILLIYSTCESVTWKLKASSAHTVRMDLTVKQETTCVITVQLVKGKIDLHFPKSLIDL